MGWWRRTRIFPSWQTVYWWLRRFVRRLLFRTIHDIALMLDRERAGRDASPSASVLDSQSVKAPVATRKHRGRDVGSAAQRVGEVLRYSCGETAAAVYAALRRLSGGLPPTEIILD